MNFFKFAAISFLLSFPVGLFLLPALGITFYGLYLLVGVMKDELLGLFMILLVTIIPLFVLLWVLAVRGGLTLLKATTGSDIGKLFSVTWRAMRFNVLLNIVIVNLFAWMTIIAGLKLMKPGFIEEFYRIRASSGLSQTFNMIELFQDFPIVLGLGGTVGACIATAALSVNFAATAAMAVDNPPGHHQLWGIGAQFPNLLVLSVLFLIVPELVWIFYAGGLTATFADSESINPMVTNIFGIYNLWIGCLLSAAAALAYKIHLGEDDIRRKRDIEEMAGLARPDGPKVDFKALRKARMGGNPVSAQDLIDDDEE